MATFHYSVFIIAIGLEWISVQCCYNNKRLGWCPRDGKLHENVCYGVEFLDCPAYHLRCGCTKHTYRRSDGECVPKSDCGTAEPKTPSNGCQAPATTGTPTKPTGNGHAKDENELKQKTPVQPPASQEPSVPGETSKTKEKIPVVTKTLPSVLLYPVASLGRLGCPSDQGKCASECIKRRYLDGNCDRLVNIFCLCSGQKPSLPSYDETSPSPTGKTFNRWPYGELENGEVVREFREKYGCPEQTNECLRMCRFYGFFHAFCRHNEPHHCFCWGLASTQNWRDVTLGDQKDENKDLPDCTPEVCDLRCRSTHQGGFCTEDPTPFCYCYDMHSPGGYKHPIPKIPKYEDLVSQTKTFLNTKDKFHLTHISLPAWLESYCDCMESTLLQENNDAIRRTLVCYGQDDEEEGTLMVYGATSATFTVSLKNGATLLELSTVPEATARSAASCDSSWATAQMAVRPPPTVTL